jgi:hypothetical protein
VYSVKLGATERQGESMTGKWWLGLVAAGLAVGCQAMPRLLLSDRPPVAAQAARSLAAQVLTPDALPADVVTAVLPAAQKAADDASRRRGIDFFRLHGNPIGLQLRAGAETAHVVSFLGTSRERNGLNVELRALVGAGQPAFVMNYTGPVTQGRPVPTASATPQPGREAGLRFEFLTGLPGGGVTEAYEDYLNHWGERLQVRFQARPFQFDDGPLVFAMVRAGEPLGYVFCNQGSRLVLGDRKDADVQAVTAFAVDGRMLGGYTLLGFNAKTAGAGTDPTYRIETDSRFGTLALFGELP